MVGDNASFQFNEAYKSLRTNLEFLAATSDCKSILVTSSVPTEGKSNVAVNLACTMAAAGKKVILMDCDLRKGTLGHYLHLRRGAPGLTGKLSGAAEWTDICYSSHRQPDCHSHRSAAAESLGAAGKPSDGRTF